MKFTFFLIVYFILLNKIKTFDEYVFQNSSSLEKLELKFEWNNTDKCDLGSLFKDNVLSSGCIAVKDSLEISTEYLFKISNDSYDFKPLDLFLNLDILVEIRSSIDDPNRDIFLEWHSQNNTFNFIGTDCILDYSNYNCSNFTQLEQPDFFINIQNDIEKYGTILSDKIELNYVDEQIILNNLDFELENAFIRIYNFSDILIDLPVKDNSVVITDIDLTDGNLTVSLGGYIDIINLQQSEIILIQLS